MHIPEPKWRETVRRPKFIVGVIIAVLVIAGASYTAWQRISKLNEQASLGTESACNQQLNDKDLCKFIATGETSGLTNYVIVTTIVDASGTEINTIEVENINRTRSTTIKNGEETDAYVVLDNTSFVKDYADGQWASYTDPEYVAATDSVSYDFVTAGSEDIATFRDNYKNVGMEPCGDLTCLKYQVILPESPNVTAYLWFDTTDYLIRRYQDIEAETTTNTQFNYQPVSLGTPSPVKVVSDEELQELL